MEQHNKKIFLYVLVVVVGVLAIVTAITITVGVINRGNADNGGNGNGGGGNGGGNNGGGGGGVLGFFENFIGYSPGGTGDIYYTGGKVGIGTSTPNYTLEVDGSLDANSITINGTPLHISTGQYWRNGTGNKIYYSDGKVGIRTSNPSYDLEVAGSFDADAITINGVSVGTSSSSYWNQISNNIYYNSGNVGIGTSTPTARLHIKANQSNNLQTWEIFGESPARQLKLDYSSGWKISSSGDMGSDIIFVPGLNGKVSIGTYQRKSMLNVLGTFSVKGATGNQGLYQDSNTNVGIGTSTPTERLEVYGTIKTSALVKAGKISISLPDTGNQPGTDLCLDNQNMICRCGFCSGSSGGNQGEGS